MLKRRDLRCRPSLHTNTSWSENISEKFRSPKLTPCHATELIRLVDTEHEDELGAVTQRIAKKKPTSKETREAVDKILDPIELHEPIEAPKTIYMR